MIEKMQDDSEKLREYLVEVGEYEEKYKASTSAYKLIDLNKVC